MGCRGVLRSRRALRSAEGEANRSRGSWLAGCLLAVLLAASAEPTRSASLAHGARMGVGGGGGGAHHGHNHRCVAVAARRSRGAARRVGTAVARKVPFSGHFHSLPLRRPPAPPLPLYGRAGCVRVGPIGERGALIAPPAPSVLGVGRAAACQRPLRLSRRFVKRVLLGLPARPRGAEPWLTEDLSPPARDGACVRPLQARARWRFRRRRCPRASSRRRPCCWAPGRCCWARGCSWPR